MRRPEWVAYVFDEAAPGAEGEEAVAVLLHLPRGERVALSGTGSRVWELITAAGAAGVRMGDLVPLLAEEYGVDPTIVDHDVSALLAQMTAGEWVEIVPLTDQLEGEQAQDADGDVQ